MGSSCATEVAPSGDVILRVAGLSVIPAAGSAPVVQDVALTLRAGECALLVGATGSGKSTLLRAVAGVLPPGCRAIGDVTGAGRAALLLQDIDPQLLFSRVDEEVASGASRRRMAPARLRREVAERLAQVGLEGFESRAVDALSAGEKQRVVLAALLAGAPRVLLLDEPTSALDPAGRRRLVQQLRALKRRGHAIVVADHVVEPFRELAERHWLLKEGRLTERAVLPADPWPVGTAPPLAEAAEEIARCERLSLREPGGRRLLAGVELRVRRGERLLVTGPNGCGKTSLLRTLAGLVPPSAGRVVLSLRRPRGAPRGLGLVFQNPQRGLFERSVEDELGFALRRSGRPRAAVRRRVEELLDVCGLGPQRTRSPLRLSLGEQHRVAVAAVLAPQPDLLLLDEPFSGLDPEARLRLLELLEREQQRRGAALLIASHDARPLEGWCHRCLRLGSGSRGDA